ncbi:TPM domain-containing protein [Aquisphaera insulae]|uniref:TPM domain-containing protein n=1 Tax=Aquisphaera insulae TaxID=2712864 RepID=UPI0013E9AF67|nr:TPM domain-containing protein [Aquisphaera insulae]
MRKHGWLYAMAVAVVPLFAGSSLEASEIRDRAGMFSTSAVRKATDALNRAEKQSGVSVVIETIAALPNVGPDASEAAKRSAVQELADRRAREIGHEGVYMLISQKDRVYSEPLVQERFASMLPRSERQAVGQALVAEFKKQRFDDGLLAAVGRIDRSLSSHSAPVPAQRIVPGAAANHRAPARFGIGSLLFIALAIFGVLLLFRVLGGAFRGANSMGGPGYGGPGYGGPGYGPGMGGPGYGYGGGGGFFSNMLGGLGGALAGNWLYDQFSGRHGSGYSDASSYTNVPDGPQYPTDTGGDNYVGGDDNGGMGGGWSEPDNSSGGGWFGGGGGDGGGGWGGGDGGGWGGGDGGGWGGGDGGGDWGGGGDAGGGW